MPQCPNCKTEIDHLVEYSPEIVYYDVRLMNGELDWEQRDEESGCTGDCEYHCPECDGFIGKGSSDFARDFLKGEKDANDDKDESQS